MQEKMEHKRVQKNMSGAKERYWGKTVWGQKKKRKEKKKTTEILDGRQLGKETYFFEKRTQRGTKHGGDGAEVGSFWGEDISLETKEGGWENRWGRGGSGGEESSQGKSWAHLGGQL